ncbi:MAG TPA: hypothetical protein VFM53_11890 [Anaeromyxobacteraceae bacterium]|nr:hypothetical protein [Anaeromyxobacteraceae bacterium]
MGPTATARSLCDDDGPREPGAPAAAAPAWRVAGSFGWLASTLRFSGVDAPFVQRSVAASLTRNLGPDWSVSAGAGAVISGSLDANGVQYAMDPGWLVRFGATWMALDARGPWPFLAVSGSLAASGVTTVAPDGARAPLTSVDAGLSASAGWPIAGVVAPYVGAKVFGGPVWWTLAGSSVTGTDVNHWQVAIGAAASLPLGIDLLVEWAPLGARSAVAQVGWAF